MFRGKYKAVPDESQEICKNNLNGLYPEIQFLLRFSRSISLISRKKDHRYNRTNSPLPQKPVSSPGNKKSRRLNSKV